MNSHLMFLMCLVYVVEFALVSIFCHSLIQWLHGQYFLPFRKADCWFNTFATLGLVYVGIILTASDAIAILVHSLLVTTGLLVGTAIWCSWCLPQENS